MSTDPAEARLIVRQTFDAAALAAAHPPRFTHPNKKLVHALSSPASAPPRGVITYSRWRAMPLPETTPAASPAHEMREDVFDYASPPAGTVSWYLNFADPQLFVAYGGSLLAQDELQVLEHPLLGSLCEALRASSEPSLRPVTVEHGASTPVLLRGVERRCALATDPDPFEGRPLGLYGNRFARAKEDAIRRALTVLTPPTLSNILAMSALPGGVGRYTEAEIHALLVTAYTGFHAAKLDSAAAAGSVVEVHTGHWGTGAFGGHKVLMALVQLVAARLAGIERLVYHTVSADGSAPFEEARRCLDSELLPAGAAPRVVDLEHALYEMGFVWGVSDGN